VFARFVDPRKLDLRDGGREIVLRLHELRSFNRRERRTCLDGISQPCDHSRDPP
jgi:hypothetical protein